MIDERPESDPDIIEPSIDPRSHSVEGAEGDAAADDPNDPRDDARSDAEEQWLETVLASLPKRSVRVREALLKALGDGDDVGPLLGLEPAGPARFSSGHQHF
ncbi:hypothetical protein [Roseibium sp.]|uniref:hypothetical protein n=1 Tax=Roseibium sp. TaxID=1936156 RepID=UPI003296C597